MLTENSVESFWKFKIGDKVYYALRKGNPPSEGTVYALLLKEDRKPSYLLKAPSLFGMSSPIEVDEDCISFSDTAFKKAHLEKYIKDLQHSLAERERELRILCGESL